MKCELSADGLEASIELGIVDLWDLVDVHFPRAHAVLPLIEHARFVLALHEPLLAVAEDFERLHVVLVERVRERYAALFDRRRVGATSVD